jgi:hypothetical protein
MLDLVTGIIIVILYMAFSVGLNYYWLQKKGRAGTIANHISGIFVSSNNASILYNPVKYNK